MVVRRPYIIIPKPWVQGGERVCDCRTGDVVIDPWRPEVRRLKCLIARRAHNVPVMFYLIIINELSCA